MTGQSCGYSSKTACRLYALFDIVFGLLVLIACGVSLNLHDNLKLYQRNGIDEVINHYINTSTSRSAAQSEINKAIDHIIKTQCDDATITDFTFAIGAAVVCIACLAVGFVGFVLVALWIFVATCCKQKNWCCCCLLNSFEIFFLTITMAGVAIFQTSYSCPHNYNILYFRFYPRQWLILGFGILILLYKIFQIRAICQYRKDCKDEALLKAVRKRQSHATTTILAPSKDYLAAVSGSIEDIDSTMKIEKTDFRAELSQMNTDRNTLLSDYGKHALDTDNTSATSNSYSSVAPSTPQTQSNLTSDPSLPDGLTPEMMETLRRDGKVESSTVEVVRNSQSHKKKKKHKKHKHKDKNPRDSQTSDVSSTPSDTASTTIP